MMILFQMCCCFSGSNFFLDLHMHHTHHPILPILERFRNLMSDFLRNRIHSPSCPLVHFQIDYVLQSASCNYYLLELNACWILTWCMWLTKHSQLHLCIPFFDFSRYHAWFCIPPENLDRTLNDISRNAWFSLENMNTLILEATWTVLLLFPADLLLTDSAVLFATLATFLSIWLVLLLHFLFLFACSCCWFVWSLRVGFVSHECQKTDGHWNCESTWHSLFDQDVSPFSLHKLHMNLGPSKCSTWKRDPNLLNVDPGNRILFLVHLAVGQWKHCIPQIACCSCM